jgi:uncharacterized protein YdeI (YjbR/CyaY-like superfamily)
MATAMKNNYDARIDAYIAKVQPFARPIIEYIRDCAHAAWPEIVETMKWGQPFFCHANGKIVCHIGAFKQHCRVGMWNTAAAAQLREAHKVPTEAGEGLVFRVESLKDLPPRKTLIACIRGAAEAAATGKSTMRRKDYQTPKPPLEVPPDFAAAMKMNKAAQKTFDSFTAPSHRREYVEWITGAKQEETRKRRIAQAVEMLAEGKTRNWKYEACSTR